MYIYNIYPLPLHDQPRLEHPPDLFIEPLQPGRGVREGEGHTVHEEGLGGERVVAGPGPQALLLRHHLQLGQRAQVGVLLLTPVSDDWRYFEAAPLLLNVNLIFQRPYNDPFKNLRISLKWNVYLRLPNIIKHR